MYYEINIAKREEKPSWNGEPSYRHLFATHERSCTTRREVLDVLADLESHGYKAPEYNISVNYNPQRFESWGVESFKAYQG